MIRFLLVQNYQGKTRLARWYTKIDDKEKRRLQVNIHRMLVSRDSRYSNFIEFMNYKLIYKRFAGLYFLVCVDSSDNELGMLEFIQFFVETLDAYFGNVCELDLIFNFHKVYGLMDELVLGGEILETSKTVVLNTLRKVEAQE